jgi:acetolactate synthase small subunit
MSLQSESIEQLDKQLKYLLVLRKLGFITEEEYMRKRLTLIKRTLSNISNASLTKTPDIMK